MVDRGEILRLVVDEGCSVREVEGLTGVSRSTVSRIVCEAGFSRDRVHRRLVNCVRGCEGLGEVEIGERCGCSRQTVSFILKELGYKSETKRKCETQAEPGQNGTRG